MIGWKQSRSRRTLITDSIATTLLLLARAPAAFAQGQRLSRPLRIGVLTDLSGPYSDLAGAGSVEAVRMAVEEFGSSILGNGIEVLSADHQNKADVGAAIARHWFDVEDVDAICDFSNSSVGFAVQSLAKDRNKVLLVAAGSSDFTGKYCIPTSSQWVYNSYTNGYALARYLTQQGKNTWFILTADYAFGHSFEADIRRGVTDNGGTVLGAARHPVGTSDFSSFLLSAQASGAQAIAFANAGADTVTAVKQAAEFGIANQQTIATPALFITDIRSLGLELAQGLRFVMSSYWSMDEKTRDWSREFFKRRKMMPSMTHSGMYSAVQHYLKAVAEAQTSEGAKVAAKMRELPVKNVFTRNGSLRIDGQMVHDLFFAEVKTPAQSEEEWDLFNIVTKIPADQAFRPLKESECPLVASARNR
jgi:branched-chain amino acid transport system substrate-binding protein